MQICVIAKEPRPGFAKTRLCPPFTPAEAAAIAEASLSDTLGSIARAPATRRVLVIDGRPGAWLPPGFEVTPQVGGGLGARLDAAFAWCFRSSPHDPVLLIGMDTPQVTPDMIEAAGAALRTGADAVLGPASDGGYWLIGFRAPVHGAFDGVPMSCDTTFRRQLARLQELGLRVDITAELDDVDSASDALQVAERCPGGRFAAVVQSLTAHERSPESTLAQEVVHSVATSSSAKMLRAIEEAG